MYSITALLSLLLFVGKVSGASSSYMVLTKKLDHTGKPSEHFQYLLDANGGQANILYDYTHVHGFAAIMSELQVEALKRRSDVIGVFPDSTYKLHTTHTPEFMGINSGSLIDTMSREGEGVIIGLVDSGIWPESKSFSEEGMKLVTKQWKGICQEGTNFNKSNCNRKLIGARFFCSGLEASLGPLNETYDTRSPRDMSGHGTHTASIAAGNNVDGANYRGYASGTSKGVAAKSMIAVYKACWVDGCFDSDVLAAIDAAIGDGVDILSISLGEEAEIGFDEDPLAVGAFAAMKEGIFVSVSASNTGPKPSSVVNTAPWLTTVGAGSIDRNFPAVIRLGNGEQIEGMSLYNGTSLPGQHLPVVYFGNDGNSSRCFPGSLSEKLVSGKIVVCDRGVNRGADMEMVVHEAGGVGMIHANTEADGENSIAEPHVIPVASVGFSKATRIKMYINSTQNATATIHFPSTTRSNVHPAPYVAGFSARGPSLSPSSLLKPDIIAPGVEILAAWSQATSPTLLDDDHTRVPFNIITGTSMACPHVSGLAALLKAAHPDWSPAVIRSALMTTASVTDNDGSPILDSFNGKSATPFAVGAGHVMPNKAISPALAYDLNTEDYIDFLCATGYNDSQIETIARTKKFCCSQCKKPLVENFNYPSFSVIFPSASGNSGAESVSVTHTRTLSNVDNRTSCEALIEPLSGGMTVDIRIQPSTLSFTRLGERMSFSLNVTSDPMPEGTFEFTRLIWNCESTMVASPIVISWRSVEGGGRY